MTRITNRVFAVLVMAAAAACDERLKDIAGPSPNLEPTFQSIQREIFENTDQAGRLSCTTCHTNVGGRVPAAGMNLLSDFAYQALVNTPSSGKPGAVRVVPGDPESSYLIHKLEGRSDIVGQRMPRTTGPFLTDGQIRIIKRWIERGAPND
jgi:hypothetical protein